VTFALLLECPHDRVQRADQDVRAGEHVIDAKRRASGERCRRATWVTGQGDLLRDGVQLQARKAATGRFPHDRDPLLGPRVGKGTQIEVTSSAPVAEAEEAHDVRLPGGEAEKRTAVPADEKRRPRLLHGARVDPVSFAWVAFC